MPNFNFTEDAFKEYIDSDKQHERKINDLLKDIARTPFTGKGKPEPLKYQDGKWSRRINDEDRLVYKYDNDTITIYQCKGHYDD